MHQSLRSPQQGIAQLFVCVCVNSHPGTVSQDRFRPRATSGSASWAEVATEQLLGKTYCFRLDKDLSIITCAFTKGLYEIRVEAESNKELALKKRKPLIPRLPFPSSYTLTLI